MLLLTSSSLLVIPPLVGNFVGPIEQTIQLAMFLIVMTSLVHWNNPVRGTFNSRFDSRLVKSTIIFACVYALFFKGLPEQQRNLLIFFIVCLAFSFYKGSQASNIQWCSDDHLVIHLFVHIFGIMGALTIFA
jgi:hypothetical protein